MTVAVLPTEPIRAEHRELLPRIEALRHTAAWMRDAPTPVVREKLAHAVDFLQHHLIPHALAEDEILYEAVEGAMGAPGASQTMRRDHVEVARMTEVLAALRDDLEDPPSEMQRDKLTELLYGLHAIVALHFSKEEEIYLPTLDGVLTAEDAQVLFERMEEAAERHRGAAHG
jgi:iron-sulfur cluster repair protein YtfE (RIC family)